MYFDNEERCADLTNGFVFKGRQVVSEQDICELDSRKTGEKKYKARKNCIVNDIGILQGKRYLE